MAEDEFGVVEEDAPPPLPLMHETGPLATNAGPSDPVGGDAYPGLPVGTKGIIPALPPLENPLEPTGEPGIATPAPEPAAAPERADYSPQAKSDLSRLIEELEASDARLNVIYQERARKQSPIYDEILQTLKERGKVQMPPMEPLPHPPSFQNNVISARNDFLGLAVMFGAIGLGRRSAGGMTTALNAFAGFSEGLAKGDKERATQEIERWKSAMDYTIKSNKQMTDQYNAIINAEDRDLETKMAMLKVVAAGDGDRIAQEALRRGNIVDLAKIVAQNQATQDKARINKLQMDKLEQTIKLAQAKTEAAKTGGVASMSEADLNELVDEYHATGRRPQLSVFGFRQAGDANRRAFQALLTERIKEENWGADWQRKAAADWTAEQSAARSGGTAAGNLDIILRSAEAALPAAEEASKKVPRGSLVRLNALQLHLKEEVSDPLVRDFALKNLQVAELWARAMNPRGVMRESDRELALGNLRMADSSGTYSNQLAGVRQFIIRERKAVQGFREHTPVEEETPATPPRTLGGQLPRSNAPPAAVQYLRTHPELRGEFDKKYGEGAADRALSGQ